MKPIINSAELRDIRYGQTLWNIGNQIINKIEEINTKKYKFRQVGQNKKYTININKQIVGGVDYIVALGTTSEAATMTERERSAEYYPRRSLPCRIRIS